MSCNSFLMLNVVLVDYFKKCIKSSVFVIAVILSVWPNESIKTALYRVSASGSKAGRPCCWPPYSKRWCNWSCWSSAYDLVEGGAQGETGCGSYPPQMVHLPKREAVVHLHASAQKQIQYPYVGCRSQNHSYNYWPILNLHYIMNFIICFHAVMS